MCHLSGYPRLVALAALLLATSATGALAQPTTQPTSQPSGARAFDPSYWHPLVEGALAPASPVCDDEIAGIWVTLYYDLPSSEWHMFEVHMQRVAENPDRLEGTIVSRFWGGHGDRYKPLSCEEEPYNATVTMTAQGDLRAGNGVEFSALDWALVESPCEAEPSWDYMPDTFTGTLDPVTGTIDAIQSDGVYIVDLLVRFVRVSCL